jgi:hypothetical protein
VYLVAPTSIEGFLMMSTSKVGIFFVVDHHILLDAISVQQGEKYGSSVCHGGHYDFWEALVAQDSTEQLFKARAYDASPRGRVVYLVREKKFVLYADKCLDRHALRLVADQFNLINPTIARDEHYQCASCNPDFLD